MSAKRINEKKTWAFWYVFERLYVGLLSLLTFIGVLNSTESVVYSTFAYTGCIIFGLLLSIYYERVKRHPSRGTFYSSPQMRCKGEVVEKHIRITRKSLWCQDSEWILFDTVDGQRIKAFLHESNSIKGRSLVASIIVGETGILVYRKGEKDNYFVALEPLPDDLSN